MRARRLAASSALLLLASCSWGAPPSSGPSTASVEGTAPPDPSSERPPAASEDGGGGSAFDAGDGAPDASVSAVPPALYFQGDMQNVTITNSDAMTGWDDLQKNPLVHGIGPFSLDASDTVTIEDGFDSGRKAMKISLGGATGGRAKANWGMELAPSTDLAVYHTSHRMYLNEAFHYLADDFTGAVGPSGSVAGWMTIMEIWNRGDPSMDGDSGGSARWTVALTRAAGANQPWGWKIVGEYMQPSALAYQDLFSATNDTVPLPTEQWFTLDLYMKRGDGKNGRMVLTLTVDGGSPQTVIDVNGPTIYPGRPDLHVRDLEPLKVYTNDAIMSWVTSHNRNLTIWFNDFKWYVD